MSLSLTLSQLSIIEKAYLFTEGFTIRAPQTRTVPFRTRLFIDLQWNLPLQRTFGKKGTKDEVVEVDGGRWSRVMVKQVLLFFNFVM